MELEQRTLPNNIEAEQSVLGAIIIDNECLTSVMEVITADEFYREAHKVIFETIVKLTNDKQVADMVTIVNQLRKEEKMQDVGGVAYVMSLPNMVPTSANVLYHAKIVHEKHIMRQLVKVGTEICAMGYDEADEANLLLDKAESRILEIANKRKSDGFSQIGSILMESTEKLHELAANKGGITGISSGFKDIDKLTSGLHPSDFIILAARPSMGKTAFALNIVQNVGLRSRRDGKPCTVAFFSLEMSKQQLVNRIICAEAGIDAQNLRTGQLSDKEWANLWNACETMYNAKIYINDTPGITAMEMRGLARRLKAEHGLDLIVVDYLQLMSGSGSGKGDRQQEVSEISRSLKALAREMDVPVIALSQLSRSVEARQCKRPMLSDLRESGSLEQDADIVAFLYRDDYYNPDSEDQNITEVIIAKHRNGPVDTVNLFFHKQLTKFVDLARKDLW